MRKEPDEIEFEIIKFVVANPGLTARNCYKHLIGKPRKETFLWTHLQELIAEGYLEKKSIGRGRFGVFPTNKAIKLVRGNGLQNGDASK